MKRALVLLPFVAAAACGPSDPATSDGKCQPLDPGGADSDCLLPWPSSFYEQSDPSTKTGLRLALPDGVMPQNGAGKAMDVTRLDQLDGWSPATPILVNLRALVDGTQLPAYGDGAADLAQSLQPSAKVQLLRYDTGERVPLFAEVDANAGPGEPQLLLVHPMVRLRPATRYVVALVGLVDSGGKPIHVAPFDALVAKSYPSSSRLAAIQPRTDELLALLEKQGVPRAQLTLAWDFHTGSDEQLLSHVVSMRDQALAAWAQQGLGYHVDSVTMPTDPHLWISVEGTFDVPSFLASDKTGAPLLVDDKGQPKLRGPSSYPFVLHVPVCAQKATRPLPILVFGHGFFGTAKGEMDSGYQKDVIDQLCVIEVGTNWIGMATDDSVMLGNVFADFSNLSMLTDPLQQAMVNFVVLARLAATKMKDDPALQVAGKPLTDGSELYYYGISQGGIFGGTVMALSPDLHRGVLDVAAGEYSLMMFRSHDFSGFKSLLDGTYSTQRDQQVLVAAAQSYFDWTDPITFAPYSIMHPLNDEHGMPMAPKRILLQESKNDAQVPNVATRVVVRTMGLPLLAPAIEPVFGVSTGMAPLDAAYSQWSVDPMPVPPNVDTPPAKDNGAHEAIRRLPALIAQLAAFYRPDGQVTQTCSGPCDFPGM